MVVWRPAIACLGMFALLCRCCLVGVLTVGFFEVTLLLVFACFSFAVRWNSLPGYSYLFKRSKLAVVADRHLKNLWNGRQGEILESPARTSLWSCDVDHVMGTIG
ncbi:hypothetical protein TSMEX_001328, partial [Taenia solium]|eukprot:TsM_001203800 transcript=TsM_001203800 gene=TsM_001203800